MNARILELLKNPELLQQEDIKTLRDEISSRPYQQSLRALHLYATQLFAPENYQSELSTTAAFTTDKKILYQFINRNITEQKSEETSVETISEEPIATQEAFEDHRAAAFTEHYVPKDESAATVFVNGERNRILFKGEEDFLERETEKIDLEQTLESGTIVTESLEKKVFADEIQEEKTADKKVEANSVDVADSEIALENQEVKAEVEPEKVVEVLAESKSDLIVDVEDAVDFSENMDVTEENKQENPESDNSLAYHGIEDFMPNVSISKTEAKENYTAPKPQLNRHEEEMKRLIEAVEAKMRNNKSKKKVSEVEEDSLGSTEINFSENQPEEVVNQPKAEAVIAEEIASTEKPNDEIKFTEQKVEWKPINLESNKPDAVITVESEVVSDKQEESELIKAENSEKTEVNISSLTHEVDKIEEEKIDVKNDSDSDHESNVPVFINTWQNWLKIDRTEQAKSSELPEKKVEEKAKVIDKFIETEPKISKLKEDSNFVVKEKTDDISHLMTETLANIYAEQRLYAKAIKAYEILSEKHPEKSEVYAQRIAEIKEMRQGK